MRPENRRWSAHGARLSAERRGAIEVGALFVAALAPIAVVALLGLLVALRVLGHRARGGQASHAPARSSSVCSAVRRLRAAGVPVGRHVSENPRF